ncbi:MAG: VWA domain-containing protein [Chitinophagales bacterium]|nr:VWA domain-containing protein [Chitinophagales bacterium]HRP38695.1 VWA domain-containing protein [Chitinophagales bacterium]
MFRILLLLIFPLSLVAQQPKTRILFLLDASYSMNKAWSGGTRWQTAMKTMIELTDSLSKMPNVEFAVRIYGHQFSLRDNNCKDSRLEMAFGNVNPTSIRKKLATIQPNGVTPIAYSLEKCANDFANVNDVSRNFLVLITDGEESCGGDPCAIAKMLQQNNIILKPIVLGIQLPELLLQQFGCIGELVNTQSGAELNSELKKAVEETISKTTFQLNLLDQSGKPTETDVAFTLSDTKTSLDKYFFHHTLNARGLPDTIAVSPLFRYNIKIFSTPPLNIENVEMKRNEHNIVSVAAPQGFIEVKFSGSVPKNSSIEKIKCLVKLHPDSATYFWIAPGEKRKVLVGDYYAEVLTNPTIETTKVVVQQSKTATIIVPAPGIVTINKTFDLYGAVFLKTEFGLQKVYDLSETARQETIALQPGKYITIYRSKFAQTIHTTIEKSFEVGSSSSVLLKL